MRRVWTCVAAVLALLGAAGLASAADKAPSYTKDVKPFFTKYCMECHNNDRAKSGYSVETFDRLTKKGRKGALVVPEKPDDSLALRTLDGKGKPMPPRKAAQPKADEIAKVRDWIKAGAEDDTRAAAEDKKADAKNGEGAAGKKKGDDDADDDKRGERRRGDRKRRERKERNDD
jgi:hypothetical protein